MAKSVEELAKIKSELEAVHKPLYTVEIPTDEDEMETRTIYLKKFDRTILSAVQKMAQGNDELKAVEVFIKNTYVGGDDINEILNDLYMLRSLQSVVVEMVSVKKAKISKN